MLEQAGSLKEPLKMLPHLGAKSNVKSNVERFTLCTNDVHHNQHTNI